MPLVRQTLNFKTVIYFADIIKENGEDISFSAVFQKMVEEGFDDLPPGGGIQSKYVKIKASTGCPNKF